MSIDDNENEKKDRVKKGARTRSPMRYPQRVMLRALLTLFILWIMFGCVFGVITAPSNDMFPRIDAGDLALYYRLDKSVKAQDVIVLRKNDTDYICRVVAVEGDTVEITEQETLIINGNTMIETDIFYNTPIYEGFVEYPLTLRPNQCFVLADRRNGGEDSRYFGPVNKNEIKGTIVTIVRRTNL